MCYSKFAMIGTDAVNVMVSISARFISKKTIVHMNEDILVIHRCKKGINNNNYHYYY